VLARARNSTIAPAMGRAGKFHVTRTSQLRKPLIFKDFYLLKS
jgi:hypothetical protein